MGANTGYLGQGLNLLFYCRYYEAEGDALMTTKYNAYCLFNDSVIMVISSQLMNQECQRV